MSLASNQVAVWLHQEGYRSSELRDANQLESYGASSTIGAFPLVFVARRTGGTIRSRSTTVRLKRYGVEKIVLQAEIH